MADLESFNFVQEFVKEKMRRQAAIAAMEANIAEFATEYGTKKEKGEETDCLTPMQKWWKQCVDLDKEMKREKERYLEWYDEAYWEQVQNEIKAREYTKNGLDDWLMVLEDGKKENMIADKELWLKAHRKRMIETARDMRAKKKRILEREAPESSTARASTESFISEEAALQSIE